jgi:hypothetical protein
VTTAAGPATIISQQPVGPAGGTLRDDSGAAVAIPPGALGQETVIQIGRYAGAPQGASLTSEAYYFGPEATPFAKPVTVTVPYDPARLPAGLAAADLRLLVYREGVWAVVQGAVVDQPARTISGRVAGFSGYASGQPHGSILPVIEYSYGRDPWTLQLDASGTVDPQGTLAGVRWQLPDDSRPTAEQVTWTAPDSAAAGALHRVRLAAIDTAGNAVYTEQLIFLPPPAECRIAYDRALPVGDDQRTFWIPFETSLTDYEFDQEGLWAEFDFGDGTPPWDAVLEGGNFFAEHTFAAAGVRTVKVRVGATHPTYHRRVQLASCTADFFVAMQNHDIRGTLVWTHVRDESDPQYRNFSSHWEETATIQVAFDYVDGELVDNGSSWELSGSFDDSNSGEGCATTTRKTFSGGGAFGQVDPDTGIGIALDLDRATGEVFISVSVGGTTESTRTTSGPERCDPGTRTSSGEYYQLLWCPEGEGLPGFLSDDGTRVDMGCSADVEGPFGVSTEHDGSFHETVTVSGALDVTQAP